ncbi:hypothetical protein ES703_14152 [subsurface metagenome]
MRDKKIPSGWCHIRLGEFLTELRERNRSSHNNGRPVLSVTNKPGFVISEEFFDRKVFSKDLTNYKVIHKGEFAYNPSRVNVGSIAHLKESEEGLLSPMYVVFRAKDGLDASYLDYWISSQRFRNLVKASTQGSVRDSLNFSALAEFPFELPPKIEQRKIVKILFSIDAVIEHTQAINEQTKLLKKGLMQELFTRGIPGRHKKFKKTEIGMIPEEWKVKTVGQLIILCQYGLSKPLTSNPQGIPILRMNNLRDGEINAYDIKYVRLSPAEEQKYLLKHGDILFNRTNSRDLVGKVAIYCDDRKMTFASYLLRLRVKSKEVDPIWLNYYFNTGEIQMRFRHIATPGVSQSNINAKVMQSLKFRIPPLEEQKKIADFINSINIKIKQGFVVKEQLSNLKSALMQVLLSGEVRVKREDG